MKRRLTLKESLEMEFKRAGLLDRDIDPDEEDERFRNKPPTMNHDERLAALKATVKGNGRMLPPLGQPDYVWEPKNLWHRFMRWLSRRGWNCGYKSRPVAIKED